MEKLTTELIFGMTFSTIQSHKPTGTKLQASSFYNRLLLSYKQKRIKNKSSTPLNVTTVSVELLKFRNHQPILKGFVATGMFRQEKKFQLQK